MESADGFPRPVVPGPTCADCQAALQSADRAAVSFLLVGTLTVPVVGCDEHLEQFRMLCGLTSEDAARLLSHRPAGGIVCPGCRLAHRSADHPVVQIEDGAAGIFACPIHEEEVISRFRDGLETHGQLSVDGPLSDSFHG